MKKKERENLSRLYAGFALAGILANDRSFGPDDKVPDLSTDEGLQLVTFAAVKIGREMVAAEEAYDLEEAPRAKEQAK